MKRRILQALDRTGIVLFCALFPAALILLVVFFGVLKSAQLAQEVYGDFVPQAWRSSRRGV